MPSTNYPEEEGIYSSDGDSQCGDTSQNLGQEQYSQRYAVGLNRGTKPQPTPRKKNRGLLCPSGTEISNGRHESNPVQNSTANQVEIANLSQQQPPVVSLTEEQITKALSNLTSRKSFSKKQFYIGIGLFVIPIFLCQLWIIQQMHDSYVYRIDHLESEQRDSTLKLLLEISDLKAIVRQELKSIRTQTSIDFSSLRSEIKKFKLGTNSHGETSDIQDDVVKTENVPISTQINSSDKISLFRNSIKSLRSEAKSQFPETWIELYSGIIHTLENESARPAAIVLLIPPSNENFGNCFAKKLAKIINSAHGRENTVLKEINSAYWERFSTSTEINDDLEVYLANSGKSVLVYDPEKIQREDFLMIFHSFCDNFMAFDKSATFIFVIQVPDHVVREHGWSETSGRGITRSILHGAWKDVISLDKRAALIARIAVNMASLKEGDSCT